MAEKSISTKTTNNQKEESRMSTTSKKVNDGTVTISQDPTLQGYGRLWEAIVTPVPGETSKKEISLKSHIEAAKQESEFPWQEASAWLEFIKCAYSEYITPGRESEFYLEEFLNEYLPAEMWDDEEFVLNLPCELLWGEHSIDVAGLLVNEEFVLKHTSDKIHPYFYLLNFRTENPEEQLLQLANNMSTQELIEFLDEDSGIAWFDGFLPQVCVEPDEDDPYLQKLKNANAEVYEYILEMFN